MHTLVLMRSRILHGGAADEGLLVQVGALVDGDNTPRGGGGGGGLPALPRPGAPPSPLPSACARGPPRGGGGGQGSLLCSDQALLRSLCLVAVHVGSPAPTLPAADRRYSYAQRCCCCA
eukprot:SAG31_NODE_5678_length_2387_cov_1.409528_1_plen_119_part_00